MKKMTITGYTGEQITIKQAAAILGMSESNTRHHITTKEIKDIKGLRKVIETIKKKGNKAYSKTKPNIHKTKYGELTLKEIFDRHPYKDHVNNPMLNERIHRHGAMSEKLWDPPQFHGGTQKTKVCNSCGERKKIKEFTGKKANKDGREYNCKECRNKAARGVYIPVKKRETIAVKPGEFVVSRNKLYHVVVCHDVQGQKGHVLANPVMGNGQILKRTSKYLGDDWEEQKETQHGRARNL